MSLLSVRGNINKIYPIMSRMKIVLTLKTFYFQAIVQLFGKNAYLLSCRKLDEKIDNRSFFKYEATASSRLAATALFNVSCT